MPRERAQVLQQRPDSLRRTGAARIGRLPHHAQQAILCKRAGGPPVMGMAVEPVPGEGMMDVVRVT